MAPSRAKTQTAKATAAAKAAAAKAAKAAAAAAAAEAVAAAAAAAAVAAAAVEAAAPNSNNPINPSIQSISAVSANSIPLPILSTPAVSAGGIPNQMSSASSSASSSGHHSEEEKAEILADAQRMVDAEQHLIRTRRTALLEEYAAQIRAKNTQPAQTSASTNSSLSAQPSTSSSALSPVMTHVVSTECEAKDSRERRDEGLSALQRSAEQTLFASLTAAHEGKSMYASQTSTPPHNPTLASTHENMIRGVIPNAFRESTVSRSLFPSTQVITPSSTASSSHSAGGGAGGDEGTLTEIHKRQAAERATLHSKVSKSTILYNTNYTSTFDQIKREALLTHACVTLPMWVPESETEQTARETAFAKETTKELSVTLTASGFVTTKDSHEARNTACAAFVQLNVANWSLAFCAYIRDSLYYRSAVSILNMHNYHLKILELSKSYEYAGLHLLDIQFRKRLAGEALFGCPDAPLFTSVFNSVHATGWLRHKSSPSGSHHLSSAVYAHTNPSPAAYDKTMANLKRKRSNSPQPDRGSHNQGSANHGQSSASHSHGRSSSSSGGSAGHSSGGSSSSSIGRDKNGNQISCKNYNHLTPCAHSPCSFAHVCSMPGCKKAHPVIDHARLTQP